MADPRSITNSSAAYTFVLVDGVVHPAQELEGPSQTGGLSSPHNCRLGKLGGHLSVPTVHCKALATNLMPAAIFHPALELVPLSNWRWCIHKQ